MSLLRLVILFLAVGFTVSSHLEDSLCSERDTYYQKIVDVNKSKKLGAKLLEGSSVSTYRACLDSCCLYDSCDLALYRNVYTYNADGSSKHNCYLLHCGEKSNCVLAHHSQFTAAYFGKNEEESVIIDHEKTKPKPSGKSVTQALPPRTQSRSVSKETSTSTSPTLVKPTPVAASSSKSIPVVSTKDELKSSSPTKAIPTNSIPHSSSSLATSLSHIVMKPTPISNTTVHTIVDNKPHKDEGEEESHFPNGSCNNGDCDNNGSGLLIGLVIGSVFFLLIALSVAAIIHKLHQNRKKKHYHNVDYLINGMYS